MSYGEFDQELLPDKFVWLRLANQGQSKSNSLDIIYYKFKIYYNKSFY